jgi:nucleotide-binding universal stress UspA family protein
MLKMQRILVATDLGPAAAALAHRLDWMAAQARPSSVCLLHVVDEAALGAAAQWGLGERAALQARSLVGAEQQLQRLRGKLHLPATVAVEVHTLVGHPATCVAELCRSRRIDLLLAGSGNRLWRQALLGSTARRLLRQVDCALWLAREDAEAAQRIERALLAVDFGASCARALALARQCWPGTALEALHVVDSTLVEQGVAGCPARALLGRPARSLLAEVAGSAAQALVLGRGDRGDAQASLGSVAEALAVHAECDLLLAARHP